MGNKVSSQTSVSCFRPFMQNTQSILSIISTLSPPPFQVRSRAAEAAHLLSPNLKADAGPPLSGERDVQRKAISNFPCSRSASPGKAYARIHTSESPNFCSDRRTGGVSGRATRQRLVFRPGARGGMAVPPPFRSPLAEMQIRVWSELVFSFNVLF